MAGNIYAWSQTAASNASADSTINWAEGQLPSTVNDSARAEMAVHAAFLADNNATSTTSGTGAAYTVTSAVTSTLATGLKFRLKMNATNTGACTLNVTPNGGVAFGAKAIKVVGVGGEADPVAGMIQANGIHEFNYDSAANSSSGGYILCNPATPDVSRISSFLWTGSLAVAAVTSALIISLKTAAGSDPSAADPVFISFRSATGTTGTVSPLAVTAATSLTISGGSTLGVTSSTAFRIWIVGFNDGGTFRLGAINCSTSSTSASQIFSLADGIASSTAEGGAGAADSAGVIYTGSAVSSKAMRVLGYADWTATGLTAGTWTTTNLNSITLYSLGMPLPGDVIQNKSSVATPNTSTNSGTYVSSGTSISITPTNAANILTVEAVGVALSPSGANGFLRFSRGTTNNTNMIGPENENGLAGATAAYPFFLTVDDLPNTTSSQAYVVQFHSDGVATMTYGNGSAHLLRITERMG